MIKNKIIAIDFDGTITNFSQYPKMGSLRDNCREVIEYIHQNNTIVLWTCRVGKFLDEALHFLGENGIKFDYINSIDSSSRDKSRKLNADIYIDDRNIFCDEINWLNIRKYFENNI